MHNMLAIIPARKGSKWLKDKNIKMLIDKPMMAYTIEAAIESSCFRKIMVSTDSCVYKEIAIKYGAEVPFLRSEKTSTDRASSWSVVEEVLENYEKIGEKFEAIALLQPTSPMRNFNDIIRANKLFWEKEAVFVTSVSFAEYPPFFCNTLEENLCMENFIEEKYLLTRQDLPNYYRINGAIYILKPYCLKLGNLYNKHSYAYIMERENSIDIDSEDDFYICKKLMERPTMKCQVTKTNK